MKHREVVGSTATTTEDDEGGKQGRLPIYIIRRKKHNKDHDNT